GASEIIRAGANALPHTPGDVNALAALMSKLVHDSSLREKLGQAGRKTAEEYFNRQRLGLQLAPIYESIFSPLRVQAAYKVMRILHIGCGNLYGGVETIQATLARYRH